MNSRGSKVPRAKKAAFDYNKNPWYFRGQPFTQDDVGSYAGFVYLITEMSTGKMYVGKKFFHGMRKQKGKTRRSKVGSDWEKYFGSCKELQERVKEFGPDNYKREILSLHTLKRDVNFNEVREQWIRNVLDEVDADGNFRYFNDNIAGRWFKSLVSGWRERSQLHNEP